MAEDKWQAAADEAANACDKSFREPTAANCARARALITALNSNIPASVSNGEKRMWKQNEERWGRYAVTGKPIAE